MLNICDQGAIVTLQLARPTVRNALNRDLIAALRAAFAELGPQARVVILAGAGPIFSAGADLAYMRECTHLGPAENTADALALAALFEAVERAPQVVVGRVQGAALGGGLGLVACCDTVVCEEAARFGFTEVRLGLVPAVIAPFVVRKIGQSAARHTFLSGATFAAAAACRMGLVHEVVPVGRLDAATEAYVGEVLKGGPQAVRQAKVLLRALPDLSAPQARDYTAQLIASIRTGDEAQAGMAAFLGKQPPPWRSEP